MTPGTARRTILRGWAGPILALAPATWEAPGPATWVGRAAAPAWAALAALAIQEERATWGATALPERRPATLRAPKPPRRVSPGTCATSSVMSVGRGPSRTRIQLPDQGIAG